MMPYKERYSPEFKHRAIRLSHQIGSKLTGERLDIPTRTLRGWRLDAKGEPAPPLKRLCVTPGCPATASPRWFCLDCAARLRRIREELDLDGAKQSERWGNQILDSAVPLGVLATRHLIEWRDQTYETVAGRLVA